ncbi:MAG TPA: cyclodeaminase/cyclohydrolase family protein [Bryobacteraceae bacterium]|nr:cyclodeaminase/cyclohydrolase family protein [Bryobacteraceae bacterium]
MAESVWKSTLEDFRDRLAGRESVPAGVSVAAVSASLGLSLFVKVLEIVRTRKDFAGDPAKIEALLAQARAESAKLDRAADEDIVAFADYMASRGTPGEAIALQRAIQSPLRAARAAAAGLQLCSEAIALTPASIAPDLGTAALILAGSLRSMLLSVESNALRVGDRESREAIGREADELKQLAKNHQRW